MNILQSICRAIRGPIIQFLAGNDLVVVGDVWCSTTGPALIQVEGDRGALFIGSIGTHDGPTAIVPRGCKPPAPTIRAVRNGGRGSTTGPADDGDDAIDRWIDSRPAAQPPPPAARSGGLVKRVALAIGEYGHSPDNWTPKARAAIREVAAAARERIAPFDPSLKWGDVAQWLEQEAGRG